MPSYPQRGFFLTFEGLDGSGKTTQIRLLKESLERDNYPIVETRQPGGTALGDKIRATLLDSKSTGIAPRAELAMMFADRAQSIHEIIEPALAAGKLVLCDRFTDSTEAYQGGGRELGSQIVLELHRHICNNLQPDLTILLLPDLAASLARARRRNARSSGADESRFESEQDAFFARVYAKYREIALREPLRVVTIEGDLHINEVHQQVIKAVEDRLHTWQAQQTAQA
ncbi:MAG TPA: dTMP kinase [Acidobacteriaceae bacterium]